MRSAYILPGMVGLIVCSARRADAHEREKLIALGNLLEVAGRLILELIQWAREWTKRINSTTHKLRKLRDAYEKRRAKMRLAIYRRRADDIVAELERLRDEARHSGPTRPDRSGGRVVEDE